MLQAASHIPHDSKIARRSAAWQRHIEQQQAEQHQAWNLGLLVHLFTEVPAPTQLPCKGMRRYRRTRRGDAVPAAHAHRIMPLTSTRRRC